MIVIVNNPSTDSSNTQIHTKPQNKNNDNDDNNSNNNNNTIIVISW